MGNTKPEHEEVAFIVEETAIAQRLIPFMGDELVAAMTPGDTIYISLNGLCSALGIITRSQMNRIQRTPTLAKGLRRIPLETRGGIQQTNCLRVDKVALWLAGIEPSRIKPQFRAKIEAYQEELAPVAMRIFMQVMGISATPDITITDPRLAALAEQYDTLMAAASFIAAHMAEIAALPAQMGGVSAQLDQAVKLLESLTSDVQQLQPMQTISPAQKLHISEAVQRTVTDSAGKPGEIKQGQIFAALYRRFHVSSYSEIPAARYEEVMTFLRDLWKRAVTGTTPEQGSLL